MANSILCEFEPHKPLLQHRVKIEFIFAYASVNEKSAKISNAITRNGVRCLGISRIIPTKDRIAGRGDAEVTLDGDWWKDANNQKRRALLDHELHHVAIQLKGGLPVTDDAGRPKLTMRRHDYDFGWFTIIAQRHGNFSIEVEQANRILMEQGEFYFPKLNRKQSNKG
jgi:hypothetical protein